MNAILIYGSCYGSTQRYAQELSRRTGWPAVSFRDMPDLTGYDTVVHLGGLYAEKVMGLAQTVKQLSPGTAFLVVTVGLGDPGDPEARERLRSSIRKRLPDGLEAEYYHLRGAMDMEKLSLRHKMMIKGFTAVMSRTAAGKKGDMAAMTQGPVDYMDLSALAPLVDRLKR